MHAMKPTPYSLLNASRCEDAATAPLALLALADELRATIDAAQPDSQSANVCLRIANKLAHIAHLLPLVADEFGMADGIYVDIIRKRLGLKSRPAVRLLLRLMDDPDRVHSYEELNDMLAMRSRGPQVLKVYASYLRSALAAQGLHDVLHNSWGAGYYVKARDVAPILRLWKAA
jgi:DNA-binding response OmpR family regulator